MSDQEQREHYKGLSYCTCINEPMGANGLEGFVRNEKYRFEYREKDKNGKPYYRVYHDSTYYETCGVDTFKKFFQPN